MLENTEWTIQRQHFVRKGQNEYKQRIKTHKTKDLIEEAWQNII